MNPYAYTEEEIPPYVEKTDLLLANQKRSSAS